MLKPLKCTFFDYLSLFLFLSLFLYIHLVNSESITHSIDYSEHIQLSARATPFFRTTQHQSRHFHMCVCVCMYVCIYVCLCTISTLPLLSAHFEQKELTSLFTVSACVNIVTRSLCLLHNSGSWLKFFRVLSSRSPILPSPHSLGAVVCDWFPKSIFNTFIVFCDEQRKLSLATPLFFFIFFIFFKW